MVANTWSITFGPNIRVQDSTGAITDLGNILTTNSLNVDNGIPQLDANGKLDSGILKSVQTAGYSGYAGQTTLSGVIGDLAKQLASPVSTLVTANGNGVLNFDTTAASCGILYTPTENATLTLSGGQANQLRELFLLITNPISGVGPFNITLPSNCTWGAGGMPAVSQVPQATTLIRFVALGNNRFLGGV